MYCHNIVWNTVLYPVYLHALQHGYGWAGLAFQRLIIGKALDLQPRHAVAARTRQFDGLAQISALAKHHGPLAAIHLASWTPGLAKLDCHWCIGVAALV